MIPFVDLDIAQQDAINQICADFKRACHAGKPPDPSSYVNRIAPELRANLAELLKEVAEQCRRGDLIGNRYRVVGKIGHGGMGEVLRVEDQNLARPLAAKVLLLKLRDQPGAAERFIQEAHITGQLQHPGIPPVHEVGQLPDGRPFFAMKLIEGETLAKLLKTRQGSGARDEEEKGDESPSPLASRPWPLATDLPRFLSIFQQIAQTIAYAHKQGVIHRDLKPLNIMVGTFAEVQVMDWGLARKGVRGQASGVSEKERSSQTSPRMSPANPGDNAAEALTTATASWTPGPSLGPRPSPLVPDSPAPHTKAGDVFGTLAYMPPEQARGQVDLVNERSDVFGLGAILCEILTGRPPYWCANPDKKIRQLEVMRQAQEADLTDALARLDRCPADAKLIELTQSYLAPDAAGRPADAGVVAEQITAYLNSVEENLREEKAKRAAAEVQAREERKRRRVTLAWAATGLLLLVSIAGAGVWYVQDRAYRRAETEKQIALNEERVRTRLDQARQIRAELHKMLDDRTGLNRLLNDPAFWQARIDAALGELKEARLLQAAGPIREPLYGQIEELEQDLQEEHKHRQTALDLEKAREEHAVIVEGKFNTAGALKKYREAFATAGLALNQHTPTEVAQRIARSPLGRHLLSALVDFHYVAGVEKERDLRERLMHTARLSQPIPRPDGAAADLVQEFLKNPNRLPDLPPQGLTLLHNLLPPGSPTKEHLLRQAHRRHPDDFWLAFLLGKNLHDAKKHTEAAAYYSAALAVRPRNTAAWNNLGNALAANKDLPAAIDAYKTALVIDKDSAVIWNNLGGVLHLSKDLPAAIDAYKNAVAIDKQLANASYNLGVALHDSKDLAAAIDAFKKALAINKQDAQAWTNLGKALDANKDLPGAIDAYKNALDIDKHNAVLWHNLGGVLHASKNLPAAIDAFKKAVAIDKQLAPAWNNLGSTLADSKDLPAAIVAYEKALAIDKQLAPAWNNLGNARRDSKDLPAAIDAYKKALAFDMKLIQAWIALGNALRATKDLPAAIEAINKALAIDKKNVLAWYSLGNALYDNKDLPAAIDAFRKAVAIDKHLAPAWTNLGNALHHNKDLPAAIDAYKKAIAIDKYDAFAHPNLGLALRDQGNFAEAVSSLERSLELLPAKHPARVSVLLYQIECRRLLALEERLPAALKEEKTSAAELVQMAQMCQTYLKRYRDAVKLYVAAFVGEPKLMQDLKAGHRYNAACAAALAAAGNGKVCKLGNLERDRLRGQALDWLRADLTAWGNLLEHDPSAAVITQETLKHWQTDADLASVHENNEHAGAWRALWSDVEQLRKTARESYTETSFKGSLTPKNREQVHELKVTAGKTYVIDLTTYLRLEDSKKHVMVQPKTPNSRAIFTPKEDTVYRIFATSYQQRGLGAYTLVIREFVAKQAKEKE